MQVRNPFVSLSERRGSRGRETRGGNEGEEASGLLLVEGGGWSLLRPFRPSGVSTANPFYLSTGNLISISPNFPFPAPPDWSCSSHNRQWEEASPGSLD